MRGHLLAHLVLSYRSIPKLARKRILGEIQSFIRLRTRFSRLQVQVFAHAAGVTFERPPARAFCLVLQIHPYMSSKPDSGEVQTLVVLRTRLSHCSANLFRKIRHIPKSKKNKQNRWSTWTFAVQIFAHTARVISVRPPARAFFVSSYRSIPKDVQEQIVGKI